MNFQTAVLFALQSKPMYLGTVDPAVIAKRRAKNKIGRAQHVANRRAGK